MVSALLNGSEKRVCVYTHIYIYIWVCIYIHMGVYIHTHTQRIKDVNSW